MYVYASHAVDFILGHVVYMYDLFDVFVKHMCRCAATDRGFDGAAGTVCS